MDLALQVFHKETKMDLSIPYKKCKDPKEAYTLVKSSVTDEYVSQFKVKANIHYLDGKNLIEATGKGFNLRISFKDSFCEIQLKLSLILRPLGKTVLNSIEKELKNLL